MILAAYRTLHSSTPPRQKNDCTALFVFPQSLFDILQQGTSTYAFRKYMYFKTQICSVSTDCIKYLGRILHIYSIKQRT